MVKIWIGVGVVLFVAVVGIGLWAKGVFAVPTATAKATTTSRATEAMLGVDQFMRRTPQAGGNAIIEGVAASAEGGVFGLIDRAEVEKCGTTTCAELVLPVRWAGAMPAPGQAVHVKGTVAQESGKMIFVASAVSHE